MLSKSPLFFVLLFLTLAGRAVPYVGYVYPAGMQRGTTNTFIVGGQGYWGPNATEIVTPGARVLREEVMPQSGPPTASQRKWLRAWFASLENGVTNAPAMPTNATARVDEWTRNRWWPSLDARTPCERSLAMRDIFVRKNRLQDSPSLRQTRIVTATVPAATPQGAHPLCVFSMNGDGASAPYPFLVTDAPHVVEPRYVAPEVAKSVTNAAFLATRQSVADAARGLFLDGRILPGETDAFRVRFRKGRWRVRVYAARLQPIIGDAVPGYFKALVTLADASGKPLAPRDARTVGHDPECTFAIPADGTYAVSIRDGLFRGRIDFVYAISLFPEGTPDGLGDFGNRDPFACRLDDGTGLPEGDAFYASEPRIVALVDPDEAAGQPEENAALRAVPTAPAFEIFAKKSSFSLRPGGGVSIPLVIRRAPGFDAPIALLENEHVRFANGFIPAGTNAWKVTMLSKRTRAQPAVAFDIYAAAVETVPRARLSAARVIPGDVYEQAFAWKHILTTERFIVRPLPPAPKKKRKK